MITEIYTRITTQQNLTPILSAHIDIHTIYTCGSKTTHTHAHVHTHMYTRRRTHTQTHTPAKSHMHKQSWCNIDTYLIYSHFRYSDTQKDTHKHKHAKKTFHIYTHTLTHALRIHAQTHTHTHPHTSDTHATCRDILPSHTHTHTHTHTHRYRNSIDTLNNDTHAQLTHRHTRDTHKKRCGYTQFLPEKLPCTSKHTRARLHTHTHYSQAPQRYSH
jgi:hypothetical protein